MTTPSDYPVLELPGFRLETGGVLDPARLAYRTHGQLAPDKSNAILLPTWFASSATACPPRPPTPPRPRPAPASRTSRCATTFVPNNALVRGHFGIERLELVIGCSMGAQQTYQWAVSYPGMVARALPFCGSPKTAPHNAVFLEGLRAVLTADPEWRLGRRAPGYAAGLRAFARVYAGWGFSQAFYWNERYRALS
ncbi:hypothetical protein [Streptomyces cuspidosporus]|uniref:AB hydrolase-1 domain-containing protein n=1 Tax=Streptomyces cuspidosporus TaxID=66882 RepID=A0ABN3H741_9ACTN